MAAQEMGKLVNGSTHVRAMGLAGLAGALLLGIGDQLLYYAPVSGAQFEQGVRAIVATAPTSRTLLGAAVAPFGAFGYLCGFWHIHQHLRGHAPRMAKLTTAGLALFILIASGYHLLWGAKALAIQAATQAPTVPALAALDMHIRNFGTQVYLAAEAVGYTACVLLAALIAMGRSDYPRWMAVLTPAIPVVALQLLLDATPAPLGSIVGGSAVNIGFGLFFLASLVVARRPLRESD